MAQMTDVMVDVETTSTDPATGAIIQLAALKFNYETGEIGEGFDRCPLPLPRRFWSDSTRDFWLGKNRRVYEQIISRSEPAEQVFRDFETFAYDPALETGLRFWAKPLTFDWPFIDSHYVQLGRQMPFYYRIGRDLNSFMAALHGNAEHPNMEEEVFFEGDKHNALHDCAYQIDCLFHAKSKFVTTEIVQ